MSSLSDEQLQDLVNLVNNRRMEFGPNMFDPLSWGEVRLLLGAVEEWQGERDEEERDEWAAGYTKGLDRGLQTGNSATPLSTGRYLGSLRQRCGLGIRAASELVGVRPSMLVAMENDRRLEPAIVAHAITRYLEAVSESKDDESGGDLPDFDGGFYMQTPAGVTVHVNGDPNMPEETAQAIGEMADKVYEHLEAKAKQEPVEVSPDLRGYITTERLTEIAIGAGYADLALFTDKYDLKKCADCGLWGTDGENVHQIEGDFYCDEHYRPDEDVAPALSPAAAATLGPEHMVNMPLRSPVGPKRPTDELDKVRDYSRPKLPDPDVARERLATALSAGGNGGVSFASTISKPRTLAEVDELEQTKHVSAPMAEQEAAPEEAKASLANETGWLRMSTTERAEQLRQIIYALQDLAVDGVMPSTTEWAAKKPAHLPVWQTIASRWPNIESWGELAKRANLTYDTKRGGRKPAH